VLLIPDPPPYLLEFDAVLGSLERLFGHVGGRAVLDQPGFVGPRGSFGFLLHDVGGVAVLCRGE
jgi:hypothetical protein